MTPEKNQQHSVACANLFPKPVEFVHVSPDTTLIQPNSFPYVAKYYFSRLSLSFLFSLPENYPREKHRQSRPVSPFESLFFVARYTRLLALSIPLRSADRARALPTPRPESVPTWSGWNWPLQTAVRGIVNLSAAYRGDPLAHGSYNSLMPSNEPWPRESLSFLTLLVWTSSRHVPRVALYPAKREWHPFGG